MKTVVYNKYLVKICKPVTKILSGTVNCSVNKKQQFVLERWQYDNISVL